MERPRHDYDVDWKEYDSLLVARPHSTHRRPTLKDPIPLSKHQWNELIKPPLGEGDVVEIGRRAGQPLPQSISEVRAGVAALDFLPIDPYVATVGSSISAGRVELPRGEFTVEMDVPGFYQDKVEVQMGTHNGEGAPMLVVLPGIHGDGDGSHSAVLKQIALERGMNYVVFPNSLSDEMLEDLPVYHPGNPRADAEASHQMLKTLKGKYPEFFSKVSLAGYSYGALHGANIVRYLEEKDDNVVNGSLVAISPPENLDHSMRELDGLRELYKEGADSITWTGLKYKRHVGRYGYERFMESDLAQRGDGTNITEIKIADKYGSRDDLQDMIETVDTHFEHNRLPRHTQEYKDGSWGERRRLRREHDEMVENMTYDQFSDHWMSKDKWLIERGLTPAEMSAKYSFSEAMEAIEKTPVLMLASVDDYILNDRDVEALRELERRPGELEVVKMFETGGHVGLTWNPAVRDAIGDFAYAAPRAVEKKESGPVHPTEPLPLIAV